MIKVPNPYESPESGARAVEVCGRCLSRRLQFQVHFPLAVMAGVCMAIVGRWLTGQPNLTSPEGWLLTLTMEFGPWFFPLSVLWTCGVVFVVATLQFMKSKRQASKTQLQLLNLMQIVFWWLYWGVFGMAQLFGTWRGC